MAKYPRDRLVLALQLLASLPSHPTSTVDEMLAELECPRTTFYDLIADLRHAGFGIEKRFLATGKVSYFISGRDRALVERILRLDRKG
jgi:hypothetical protein